MQYREFLSLTDDEVKQIVNDIFIPEKITCITRSKKHGEIRCKIYVEWETTDENDEPVVYTAPSDIVMSNPFDNHEESLLVDDNYASSGELLKLKQFCFAKGIYETSVVKNNPYL